MHMTPLDLVAVTWNVLDRSASEDPMQAIMFGL